MHRNNCNKNMYEINKEKNKILLRAVNTVMQQWEIHIVTQYEKTKYYEDVISPQINCLLQFHLKSSRKSRIEQNNAKVIKQWFLNMYIYQNPLESFLIMHMPVSHLINYNLQRIHIFCQSFPDNSDAQHWLRINNCK